ncbi:MAG: hypothetical protein GIW99_08150 [Candidatus Eremiobacteraeota bacterium]|nr:hypothetical protein [Candidatus Eremiobacteraeota bacterium]MBC5827634.1 hypothetical protein [Candidatus Eremiobacteraeota bacterium]
MINRQFDAVAELQAAFQVLSKNWILALPTAIASLVAIVFLTSMAGATALSVLGAGSLSGHPGGMAALLGMGSMTLIGGGALIFLITAVAHATVIGAAEDAWRGQQPDLSRGLSRAVAKLPSIIIAAIILAVAAMVCAILVIAAGLGLLLLLALGFTMMYVLPAIVVGSESGTSALGASWRLSTRNFAPSIAAFIGIVAAYIVGGLVSATIGHVPVLGWIAAFFVGGLTSAFAALVSVRFYDVLGGAAVQPLAAVDLPPRDIPPTI